MHRVRGGARRTSVTISNGHERRRNLGRIHATICDHDAHAWRVPHHSQGDDSRHSGHYAYDATGSSPGSIAMIRSFNNVVVYVERVWVLRLRQHSGTPSG